MVNSYVSYSLLCERFESGEESVDIIYESLLSVHDNLLNGLDSFKTASESSLNEFKTLDVDGEGHKPSEKIIKAVSILSDTVNVNHVYMFYLLWDYIKQEASTGELTEKYVGDNRNNDKNNNKEPEGELDDSNIHSLNIHKDTFQLLENKVTAIEGRGFIMESAGLLERIDEFVNSRLEDIISFYLTEKITLIELLCAMIRVSSDNHHPYQEISASMISNYIDKYDFPKIIMDQYESLIKKNVPNTIEHMTSLRNQWIKHIVKARIALLDVLFLLFYSHVPSSVDYFEKILKLSKLVPNRKISHFMSIDNQKDMLWIDHLFSLILIEILNVDYFVNSDLVLDNKNNEKIDDKLLYKIHPILKNSTKLKQLESIMEEISSLSVSSTHDEIQAMVLLGWSTFLCLLVQRTGLYLENLISLEYRYFGIKAFQELCVLNHIKNTLEFPLMVQNIHPNTLVYKNILKGLMNGVLSAFQVSFLPQFEEIVYIYSLIFEKSPDLSNQFWETDSNIENVALLLNTCQGRFPVDFLPFIRLLNSLINDESSSRMVCRKLSELNEFSSWLVDSKGNPVSHAIGDIVREDLKIQVVNENGFMSGGIILPYGCQGIIISPAGMHPEIVKWNYVYSGWDYFLFMIDSYLRKLFGKNVLPVEHEEIIIEIFGLFEKVFKYCPSMFSAIEKHLEILYDNRANLVRNNNKGEKVIDKNLDPEKRDFIIGKLTQIIQNQPNSSKNAFRIISKALSCMRQLVSSRPVLVWQELQKLMFTSTRHTSSLSTRYHTKYGVGSSTSTLNNMKQILLNYEVPVKKYCVTQELLKLIVSVVKQIPTVMKCRGFSPILSHVRNDVWALIEGFSYNDPLEFYSISNDCLELFQLILSDSSLSIRYFGENISNNRKTVSSEQEIDLQKSKIMKLSETNSPSYLSEYFENLDLISPENSLHDSLLNGFLSDSHLFTPLLNILAVGEKSLGKLLEHNKRMEENFLENLLLTSLGFLKTILELNLAQGESPISAIENEIMTRMIDISDNSYANSKLSSSSLNRLESEIFKQKFSSKRNRSNNDSDIFRRKQVPLFTVLVEFIHFRNLKFVSIAIKILHFMIGLNVSRPSFPFLSFLHHDPFLQWRLSSLLKVTGGKTTHSKLVRINIIDLISACTKDHSGLTEYFLSIPLSSKSTYKSILKKSKNSGMKHSVCLFSILNLLNNSRSLIVSEPELMVSCSTLFTSLWVNRNFHRYLILYLRKSKPFWKLFIHSLPDSYEQENAYNTSGLVDLIHLRKIQSNVLKVLSLELFYIYGDGKNITVDDNLVSILNSLFSEYPNFYVQLMEQFFLLTSYSNFPKETLSSFNEYCGINLANFIHPLELSRRIGENYIYDINLLERYLHMREVIGISKGLEFTPEKSTLLKQVYDLNIWWSQVDVELDLVENCSMFMRIILRGKYPKLLKLEDSTVIDVGKVIVDRLNLLSDELKGPIQVLGISKYCEILLYIFKIIDSSKDDSNSLITPIITLLNKYKSNRDLGRSICVSLYVLLTKLDLFFSPKIKSLTQQVYPLLVDLLIEELTDIQSKNILGLNSEYLKDIQLLLSFVGYCLDIKENSKVWISVMEESGLVPVLIDTFINVLSNSSLKNMNFSSLGIIESSIFIILKITFFEKGTELVALSSFFLACSTLSKVFLSGKSRNFRKMKSSKEEALLSSVYIGEEYSPYHRFWCLILSCVAQIGIALSSSSLLRDQLTQFMTTYHNRFIYALNHVSQLYLADFQEIERILEFLIVYSTKRVSQVSYGGIDEGYESVYGSLPDDIVEAVLRLTSRMMLLYHQPTQLARIGIPMSKWEKSMASLKNSKGQTVYSQILENTILNILCNCFTLVRIWTPNVFLKYKISSPSLQNPLISAAKTGVSSSDEPPSIGSLISVLNYSFSRLRRLCEQKNSGIDLFEDNIVLEISKSNDITNNSYRSLLEPPSFDYSSSISRTLYLIENVTHIILMYFGINIQIYEDSDYYFEMNEELVNETISFIISFARFLESDSASIPELNSIQEWTKSMHDRFRSLNKK